MLRRFDSNPAIAESFIRLTRYLAANRGLLLLAGTGLAILSLVLSIVVMVAIVSSSAVGTIWLLLLLPLVLLHLAVILGFIGMMLIIPLGQSYGD